MQLRYALLAVGMALTFPIFANAQNIQKGIEAYYKEDYDAAKQELLPLANTGNAKAKAIIGTMYMVGWGFPVDVEEGLRLCTETANQGDAHGENCLGNAYIDGIGVAQDDAEAVVWYRKSADQGLAAGQTNLAAAYSYGIGVAQDFAEAFKWYQKAADQGYANAQFAMGYAYSTGQGVPQDYAQAVNWYTKAADQGHDGAQTNLGNAYYFGEGVEKSHTEALNWYRKAADQGISAAQYAMGYAYYKGDGVSQDYAKALNWYKKAADQGNNEAIEFLESDDERQQFLNGEPTQRFINSASFVTTGGLEEDLRKPSGSEISGRFGNCTAIYEVHLVDIRFEARFQVWYDFNKVNWKSANIETIGASKSFVYHGEVGVIEHRLAPNTPDTAKQMLMLAGIFDGKTDQTKHPLSVTEERYTAAVQDLMEECPGIQSTY